MHFMVYRWSVWNQIDVEYTLQQLGHQITVFEEKPVHFEEDVDYVQKTVSSLEACGAKVLFSINYFPLLACACHNANIPYLCWNVDGSLLSMYDISVFYPTNYIFTFDQWTQEYFSSKGVSHIWHMPLGACMSHFDGQLFMEKSPDYQYDVSFIGSLYERNIYDQMIRKLPDYLAGYLDAVICAQEQQDCGTIFHDVLTQDICERLSEYIDYQRADSSFADLEELLSTTVLGFKVASRKRCRTLNQLSLALRQMSPVRQVHLFSTDAFEMLPLVHRHAPVDYTIEMPHIFSSSRININLTTPTIESGIPLRVWDVLGCGGFLLTDQQRELSSYLTPGKDLILCKNSADFVKKAKYYLTHEEERKSIAIQGQKTVRNKHTLIQRMTQLLEIYQRAEKNG